MFGIILNIIICIIVFDLGRKWEKSEQKYNEEKIRKKAISVFSVPFQSEASITVKCSDDTITISDSDDPDGFTTVYDENIPINYT